MKRLCIILVSLIAIAACATTKAGSSDAGGSKSIALKADSITSFVTTLPVSVVITDSSSPGAFIEIPSEVIASWVICRIKGSSLMIYPHDKYRNKLNALSADNPIKVHIESSAIREITSTSSAEIVCRNKRFAKSLSINNTGRTSIAADNITLENSFSVSNTGRFSIDIKQINAADNISIFNTGRLTSSTERFECRTWQESNTGVVDLSSHIEAKEVIFTTTGRDHLSLEVKCDNLEINSTGAGSMKFTGTADNISVSSNGSAQISTSGVLQPKH